MTTNENVTALMNELGPQIDCMYLGEFEPGIGWKIVAAEDVEIYVYYTGYDNRLVLSGDIGQLDSDAPSSRHVVLLKYNSAWNDTGGLRIGIDEDDTAVLLYDIPVEGLTVQKLGGIVVDFFSKVADWQGAMKQPQPRAESDDMPDPSAMMIRV